MSSNIFRLQSFSKNFHIKVIVLGGILAISVCLSGQDEGAYVCAKGKIHFFSPVVTGDIDATTNSAVCVINVITNKVYAKVLHTTFLFKDRLMQEHFNENYMETDKYPYATLDMQITDKIDYAKDGTYDVTLNGTFEVHGVKVTREIKGKLVVKNGQPVNATATFVVKLADHNIKIPKILGAHIADDMKVDVEFNFEKYKKS